MRGSLLGFSAVTLLLVTACGGSKNNSDTGQTARCGDGTVDAGEACDDGNQDDTDACTSACKVAACGDGFVEAGKEACDDGAGNSDSTPGACRTSCKKAVCGDGATDPGEACDDGNTVADDACTNTCTAPRCGDGILQSGEACDDGAANSNDLTNACRTDCTKAHCGDGVKDDGEGCDDGNKVDDDACSDTCKVAVCGDGIVQLGEECDQGAENSDSRPDACRLSCKKARCDDGVVDSGEQCDDANQVDSDACTNRCTAARCGDGVVEAGVEDCDNGAANSATVPDACRPSCKKASCGDTVVDSTETCDDGNLDNTDACTDSCQKAVCGDGVIHAGVETCDDGAGNSDTVADACRTSCKPASCGDGAMDKGEDCDDGNVTDTDACTAACKVASCGDGIVEAGVEGCDDGAKNDDTTPDACRTSCQKAGCGDGVLDKGESCDDGNVDDGDGCSAKCYVELPGVGDDLTVEGSLDRTDATWSRPEADCTTENKGSYDYDSITFVNPGKDPLILDLTATYLDNGFLLLYGSTFDSQKPTASCLSGNDDLRHDTLGSRIAGLQVGAGEVVTVVITTHDTEVAIGDWSLDVQTSVCGDSDMGPGETCDDGNTDSGDGCSSSCQDENRRESEPNDSEDEPNKVAVGDVTRAAIDPFDDSDYFTFDAIGGTTYDVRIWAGSVGACDVGTGDSNNTYINVYNKKYSWVNDDSFFAGPCSELGVTIPEDGTYFVQIASNDFQTIDPYWLEITAVQQESEANDDIGSANAMALRQTVQGTIGAVDGQDPDFYSFGARSGVTYTLLTYAGEINDCYPLNGNSSESTITLWDGDGNKLGFDDGDGQAPCSLLTFTPDSDGTYYVEVDGADTIDPYFLQVIGPP